MIQIKEFVSSTLSSFCELMFVIFRLRKWGLLPRQSALPSKQTGKNQIKYLPNPNTKTDWLIPIMKTWHKYSIYNLGPTKKGHSDLFLLGVKLSYVCTIDPWVCLMCVEWCFRVSASERLPGPSPDCASSSSSSSASASSMSATIRLLYSSETTQAHHQYHIPYDN